MAELDTAKKAAGNAVDEFMAHHFLEKNNETLTVQQMREQLRQVGIDKVKLVPLIHYLIFRYVLLKFFWIIKILTLNIRLGTKPIGTSLWTHRKETKQRSPRLNECWTSTKDFYFWQPFSCS